MKKTKITVSEPKAETAKRDLLPKLFLQRIRRYKSILKEVDTTTEDSTIEAFLMDANPETELFVWEDIAIEYLRRTHNKPEYSIADKKKHFRDALNLTLGGSLK